jgi:uncharacterized membrane protein YjjB (DUF3815 family)
MEYLNIIEKCVWFGIAALGFAVLFNVPQRVLFTVWMFGSIGGFTKLILISFGSNIILASLGGSILIGILTISAAHKRHAPPLVFTIPSVIPLVPGVFAYRMMLGIMQMAGNSGNFEHQILIETVSNGLNMFFILLAIAVGASFPLLVTRKESVKNLKLFRKKKMLRG